MSEGITVVTERRLEILRDQAMFKGIFEGIGATMMVMVAPMTDSTLMFVVGGFLMATGLFAEADL